MDLIDRTQLLEIIDRGQAKFGDHMLVRWKELIYMINKMPSVVLDEPWKVDAEALTELITKE